MPGAIDYYLRKEKIKQLLLDLGVPYANDIDAMESTVSTWTNSNLSLKDIEEILFSTKLDHIPNASDNKPNAVKDFAPGVF